MPTRPAIPRRRKARRYGCPGDLGGVFVEEGDIQFTTLAKRLREEHGAKAPSYQALWRAAAEGRIPAHKVTNRWYVHEEDMPLVEAEFGLTASPHAGADRNLVATAA